MAETMCTVKVRYFAGLRERRGVEWESLTTGARTTAALYEELAGRYGFSLPRAKLRVALNDHLAGWETELTDGDTVVFLTPFGGG